MFCKTMNRIVILKNEIIRISKKIKKNVEKLCLKCVTCFRDSIGKHSSPVWQLKWIERDKGSGEEKGEVLISTSADGRVTQWSIRKGFEYLGNLYHTF